MSKQRLSNPLGTHTCRVLFHKAFRITYLTKMGMGGYPPPSVTSVGSLPRPGRGESRLLSGPAIPRFTHGPRNTGHAFPHARRENVVRLKMPGESGALHA